MRFSPVHFEPDVPVPAQVTQLIGSFHALTEMHVDRNVEWVADALRAAPSLRQMTLNYPFCKASHPGIREIMIECSAALTITGCGEDVIAMVCAGLEATTSLTDHSLSLVVRSDTSAVSSVLESLQRNSTLVRFVGYFNNDSVGDCLRLPNLLVGYLQSLRHNHKLKFLILRPSTDVFLWVGPDAESRLLL